MVWKTLKSENKWRPFKLQHYWERPEYWEKSRRLEETCCHSNSSERPSADAGVKNSQGVIIIIAAAAAQQVFKKKKFFLNSWCQKELPSR